METIILRGHSKVNSSLILKFAKQLNFSAKRISLDEVEETAIALSIAEGIESGILSEKEKQEFLMLLKQG
jgi:hypothetical protein